MPPKTIHLVRHGQSTANARSLPDAAGPQDVRYRDARLTPLGETQARSLSRFVGDLQPDLIVSSPMTRALQTCLLACAPSPAARARILVTPLCAEMVAHAGDIGSPAAELRARFPGVDLGRVAPADGWWFRGGAGEGAGGQELVERLVGGEVETEAHLRGRFQAFLELIEGREERNIIVFAHGVFLTRFLRFATKEEQRGFDNCEVRKWVIS